MPSKKDSGKKEAKKEDEKKEGKKRRGSSGSGGGEDLLDSGKRRRGQCVCDCLDGNLRPLPVDENLPYYQCICVRCGPGRCRHEILSIVFFMSGGLCEDCRVGTCADVTT